MSHLSSFTVLLLHILLCIMQPVVREPDGSLMCSQCVLLYMHTSARLNGVTQTDSRWCSSGAGCLICPHRPALCAVCHCLPPSSTEGFLDRRRHRLREKPGLAWPRTFLLQALAGSKSTCSLDRDPRGAF